MNRISQMLIAFASGVIILSGCASTIVAGDDTRTNSAPHMTGGSTGASGTAGASVSTQSTDPASNVNQIRTTNANKATIE